MCRVLDVQPLCAAARPARGQVSVRLSHSTNITDDPCLTQLLHQGFRLCHSVHIEQLELCGGEGLSRINLDYPVPLARQDKCLILSTDRQFSEEGGWTSFLLLVP